MCVHNEVINVFSFFWFFSQNFPFCFNNFFYCIDDDDDDPDMTTEKNFKSEQTNKQKTREKKDADYDHHEKLK